MNSYPKLNHENLDAYQAAIEFLALATRILEHFPRGHLISGQLASYFLSEYGRNCAVDMGPQ
jgi:hypothetical protein